MGDVDWGVILPLIGAGIQGASSIIAALINARLQKKYKISEQEAQRYAVFGRNCIVANRINIENVSLNEAKRSFRTETDNDDDLECFRKLISNDQESEKFLQTLIRNSPDEQKLEAIMNLIVDKRCSARKNNESSAFNKSHYGVVCDGCWKNPITGVRYKCLTCEDYDLCSECFNKALHRQHLMLPITEPDDWRQLDVGEEDSKSIWVDFDSDDESTSQSDRYDLPFEKTYLWLTIIEAKLEKKYGPLWLDQYCLIRVGDDDEIYRTAVDNESQQMLETSRHAFWDKLFEIPLNRIKNDRRSIHIEIFDDKLFTKDKLIAWTKVKIPDKVWKENDEVERWCPLSGRQGADREGKIRIKMEISSERME